MQYVRSRARGTMKCRILRVSLFNLTTCNFKKLVSNLFRDKTAASLGFFSSFFSYKAPPSLITSVVNLTNSLAIGRLKAILIPYDYNNLADFCSILVVRGLFGDLLLADK